MYLKTVVLNNSGNVGKSTLCHTLLKPRLENGQIIKVETINTDGTNDVKISAKYFDEILATIDQTDCAIVDVGASNVEQFMSEMFEYSGIHEVIDYFILPITSEEKQQQDSIVTIQSLLDLGVEIERIKLIFNKAQRERDIKSQFKVLFDEEICKPLLKDSVPVVYFNNVFPLLTKYDLNYEDVYEDKRTVKDFRDLIRDAATKEERAELSNIRSIKALINRFNEELDIAFKQLKIV